jgi:hypothetical protein
VEESNDHLVGMAGDGPFTLAPVAATTPALSLGVSSSVAPLAQVAWPGQFRGCLQAELGHEFEDIAPDEKPMFAVLCLDLDPRQSRQLIAQQDIETQQFRWHSL